MTRFLRYSIDHDQKIRAVFLLNGEIQQKTIKVLTYDENTVTLLIGARKKPQTLPMSDMLSCGYARGDSGES